jgi:SAM-dependent methyltransferase
MLNRTVTKLPIAKCRLCSENLVDDVLALGAVAISNRFNSSADYSDRVNLSLTACKHCGLIQLFHAPSPQRLVPRVGWIRYREPEKHLDDLVERLTAASEMKGSSAIGVGPFEETLLAQLHRRGWTTSTLKLVDEADRRTGHFPYLETWQARLTTGMGQSDTEELASYDLVTCRYLLEHSDNPLEALSGLGSLIKPGGKLVIEVPDSAKFLANNDYCFPWEEHRSYFVEETFIALCRAAGFAVSTFLRYPGELEDALVAILKKAPAERPQLAASAFADYNSGFAPQRNIVRSRLGELAAGRPEQVALFGMGHQAIMFANVFGLQDLIGVVVDDDANKVGLYPPGFGIPITSSKALLDNGAVTVCLLAVSPLSELKVRERLAPLVKRGVRFFSIFAGVPGSISLEN